MDTPVVVAVVDRSYQLYLAGAISLLFLFLIFSILLAVVISGVLFVKLAQLVEIQRDYIQVTNELKSALVDAVFARETNREREDKYNSHLTTLIDKLGNIADPPKTLKGYREISLEEVQRKIREAEASKPQEAPAPYFPSTEDFPSAPDITEGMKQRLHKLRLQRKPDLDEDRVTLSSPIEVSTTPTGT